MNKSGITFCNYDASDQGQFPAHTKVHIHFGLQELHYQLRISAKQSLGQEDCRLKLKYFNPCTYCDLSSVCITNFLQYIQSLG